MLPIVLMPAHNEAARLTESVSALVGTMRVVVIDDGSRDASAELASAAGAEVLQLPQRRGKGAALQAGLDLLAKEPAETLIVLLDADLGASAAHASELLIPIQDDVADMVIAILERPLGAGGFGLVMRTARDAIRELGGGFEAQAPLSGQRCLHLGLLRQLVPFAPGYGVEVALSVRALRQGLSLLELPVAFTHQASGSDLAGFLHRGQQWLDVRRAVRQLRREG